MNKIIFSIILILIFLGKLTVCYAINEPVGVLEEGYYVVVGAYAPSQEHFAKRFTRSLQEQGLEASYGYSPYKDLLFVYVYYDRDFKASLQKMRKIREKDEFNDTWVYVMGDYDAPDQPKEQEKESLPVVKKTITEIERDDEPKDTTTVILDTLKSKSEKEALKKLEEKVIFQEKKSSTEKKKETLEDYLVFINLYNAANFHDVSGEIQVVDPVRASLLDVVESGSYLNLPDPNNRTGELLLICDIFGYRKMQKEINYYHPFKDTVGYDVEIIADIYVVNFDLVRYHVGDIATMFHVYFFKDAAIMRPESKYEVNQLLEMMKENPHYKIKIHGHVNGRNPGPIIYPGEDNNLFTLTEDDKTGFGSAKKLSKERALLIKEYLIQNGIDPERMEIKAWGGRRMLYDKHSSLAHKNVRVEIEILEE